MCKSEHLMIGFLCWVDVVGVRAKRMADNDWLDIWLILIEWVSFTNCESKMRVPRAIDDDDDDLDNDDDGWWRW